MNLSATVIQIIETTIKNVGSNGQKYEFDGFCQRVATGLIQDLATGMNIHVT